MTRSRRNAALVGYVLGGALGLIRFIGARTVQDALLATALIAMELGIVRAVEKKAVRWEEETERVHIRNEQYDLREKQAVAVSEEFARRKLLLGNTTRDLSALDAACEHDHLMSDAKTLTAIANNAVRNGYLAGIARNGAILGGQREKEQ